MKATWKAWIDAVLRRIKDSKANEQDIYGLQVHHFETVSAYQQWQASALTDGLSLTVYQDRECQAWLRILGLTTEPKLPAATRGTLMFISPEPFAGQQNEFMRLATHSLRLYADPISLNKDQRSQWQWIIDKIECTMTCDYKFRNEYVQELVLQAVHFALKRVSEVSVSSHSFQSITFHDADKQAAERHTSVFGKFYMKKATLILILILGLAQAGFGQQPIFKKGSRGSASSFTGTVWVSQLIPNDTTFHCVVGNVTFEPGARSFWHAHQAGQLLLVTEGTGYTQERGKPVQVLHKGDVITCKPGVEHWHGAAPNRAMTHISINPNTENGVVTWLKPVTDAEYPKQ